LKKEAILSIYGKKVKVHYKQAIVKARFLKYETVKVVWVKFDERQSLRLLISTDTTLKGEEIIQHYAPRWDIESMFNQLKNRFRFKDIMMHSPRTYYQFLYFKIWCFLIIKLSSIQLKQSVIDYIKKYLPWRVHHEKGIIVTAGSTQLALQNFFSTLHIDLFPPKVDKNMNCDYTNNIFLGFWLDIGYQKSG